MKIYKIRDMQTGLFSTGGYCPTWNKQGKIWSTLGKVKSHLTMCQRNAYYRSNTLNSQFWEVVEYSVEESSAFPANSLLSKDR